MLAMFSEWRTIPLGKRRPRAPRESIGGTRYSNSPSWKIGPRCSPKACIKHSGNAQAVIRGTPGRGREENARSIVSHLMRLPKRCSPNHRTSDSGNALQWREDNRCVSSKAGASRADNISCAYSYLMRLPIACSPNNRTIDSGNAVQYIR